MDYHSELAYVLEEALRYTVVEVEFVKKDGEVRLMKCTLEPGLIPREQQPIGTGTSGVEVCAVFDVEKQGWRSFRYDAVNWFKITV